MKNPFGCAVALLISMDALPYDPAKTTRGNGKLTPFEHAPDERLTRFQVRENPKPNK